MLGPTTTQVVGLPPPTPQGVTVARGAGDGEQVVVAWQAVGEPDSGITYQVRQQNPSGPVRNTDALSVTIDGVARAERPCFVVIAISTGRPDLQRERPRLPPLMPRSAAKFRV